MEHVILFKNSKEDFWKEHSRHHGQDGFREALSVFHALEYPFVALCAARKWDGKELLGNPRYIKADRSGDPIPSWLSWVITSKDSSWF